MASPSWFKSRRVTEAAKKGDLEALSGILNHETVDVTDKWKKTPLMYAAENGHSPVVKKLLRCGANVDAMDKSGWAALMMACSNNRIEVVRQLMIQGADTSLKNKEGFTALMKGAYYGHEEVVKELMLNGADLEIRNDENKTALNIAEDRNNQHIVTILKHYPIASIKEFDISMTCHELCLWLRNNELGLDIIECIRAQEIDGDTFMQLSTEKDSMTNQLGYALTLGTWNKLCRLIQEAKTSMMDATSPRAGYLSIADLQRVRRLTWDVRSQWLDVGLALDIDKDSLDTIVQKGSDDKCYTEVLTVWIRRGTATMTNMKAALEDPTVGRKDIALSLKLISETSS